MEQRGDILIYQTEDGLTKISTTFVDDTVWLSIDQMAELFQRDRSVVGKHIRNIFKEGELEKNSVWAKFAHTATDGKEYQVDYYNLDVVISVSGEQLLEGNGSVSHNQAMEKATEEFKKYKQRTLSSAEQDYLSAIKLIEEKAKSN